MQPSERTPSWMSKHPVFCSILNQVNDGHRYPEDPFVALASRTKQTHDVLLRNTPGSLGAKVLIASTALRAYRDTWAR